MLIIFFFIDDDDGCTMDMTSWFGYKKSKCGAGQDLSAPSYPLCFLKNFLCICSLILTSKFGYKRQSMREVETRLPLILFMVLEKLLCGVLLDTCATEAGLPGIGGYFYVSIMVLEKYLFQECGWIIWFDLEFLWKLYDLMVVIL